MDLQRQFDIPLAVAAREVAIAEAEHHAQEAWKETALQTIRRVATQLPQFTTDDVWRVLLNHDQTTHEPRALGALMRQAAKLKYIAPTDMWLLSHQVSCHRRPKRVWRSLL